MTKKTRRAKARRALLALSLVLVTMLVTVGGTLAWLTASSDPVVNSFTASNIAVELEETKQSDGSDLTDDWTAQLVPGMTYTKNPTAAVASPTDVDALLFVKIEETGNTFGNEGLRCYDYTVDEGADKWQAVTGHPGVYYRKVLKAEIGTKYRIIVNDQVTVNTNLTKEDMPSGDVKLTFTAYAHQLYKTNTVEFTAVEAWENLNPNP